MKKLHKTLLLVTFLGLVIFLCFILPQLNVYWEFKSLQYTKDDTEALAICHKLKGNYQALILALDDVDIDGHVWSEYIIINSELKNNSEKELLARYNSNISASKNIAYKYLLWKVTDKQIHLEDLLKIALRKASSPNYIDQTIIRYSRRKIVKEFPSISKTVNMEPSQNFGIQSLKDLGILQK